MQAPLLQRVSVCYEVLQVSLHAKRLDNVECLKGTNRMRRPSRTWPAAQIFLKEISARGHVLTESIFCFGHWNTLRTSSLPRFGWKEEAPCWNKPLRQTLGERDMLAREMIGTHPEVKGNINDALIRCIEGCYSCAQTCISCADACLAEDMVKELRQCIRLNLDCADICAATGSVATRRTGSNEELIRLTLQACAAACRMCGAECDSHASMHEHCRICAESCRRCEQACQAALQSMAA